MLYVDSVAPAELRALRSVRSDACVSIYLPTTPIPSDIDRTRIELGNVIKQATSELENRQLDKRRLAQLVEELDDLAVDDEFWRMQARTLAIFATPDHIHTFRLANQLPARLAIADRFHLKPLLRAVTFPHDAFVLALSENDARLIEVLPDMPAQRVRIPGLPRDAASAVGVSSINNRMSMRRVMGGEGQKVRLTQYARLVDSAIRPVLAGREVPLILAAKEPLASIFRSVSHHTSLTPEAITSTDDRSSDDELAAASREILDAVHARELEEIKNTFERRADEGRATFDIAVAARAATMGAVEMLIADMDQIVHGTVDEQTGAVTFAPEGPDTYGVVDEIMGRAMETGARVLSARAADIPGGGALAATLRYRF